MTFWVPLSTLEGSQKTFLSSDFDETWIAGKFWIHKCVGIYELNPEFLLTSSETTETPRKRAFLAFAASVWEQKLSGISSQVK